MTQGLPDLARTVADLTRPGSPFEVGRAKIRGHELRVFTRAPRSLRDLYTATAESGDTTFLVYEGERSTFAEILERTAAVAYTLVHTYGIEKGDRVAIAARNYPEWCLSFMAVTSIGAIAVPMNAWWTRQELEYGLRDSGARLLFVDQQRLERMTPSLDALGLPVVAIRHEGALPPGVVSFADLLHDGGVMPEVPVDPDDDALIMYTSGSTGHPKGSVSSHRAVVSALMTWEFRQEIARVVTPELFEENPEFPPATLLTVPLFHVTGSHALFLLSFRLLRKVVIMHKWNAERALELIEQERITSFTGVPTMSWEMMHSPAAERYDLRSLKALAGGGAPRPPEQVRQLAEKFPNAMVGIGYGLTETNAIACTSSGDLYRQRPASCGRPSPPLVDLKIVDEAGHTLGPNEDGEVCIRSCVVFRGYWNKPAETADALDDDGWFHTGDIGHLDPEGFLFITDRAKDLVIRGGENVACTEVEGVLFEHDGVFEAAVFGVPDERLGETVAAVVVPKPGRTLTADELRAHVADRLAKFKAPEHVWIRDEALPRIASGKIFKRGLRKQAIETLTRDR